MASPSNVAGLDYVITIKVQYHGTTRRTKMPLRDMVPRTLESNIRAFLHIPGDAEVIFERYSNSAASFVLLEPGNIAAYKQLYRAAKAKSKLKIRVSIKDTQAKITIPKPVTVEDEPEVATSTSFPLVASEESQEKIPEEVSKETSEDKSHEKLQESPGDLLEALTVELPEQLLKETGKRKTQESEPDLFPLPTPAANAPSPSQINNTTGLEKSWASRNSPSHTYNASLLSDTTRYIREQQDAYRGLNNHLASLMELQLTSPTRTGSCTFPPNEEHTFNLSRSGTIRSALGAAFAVSCNNCKKTISNSHYHCSTCDDGDFDLCQSCIDKGVTCHGKYHWLIKRTTVNGQLVQSTTETIPIKSKANPEAKVETTMETVVEPSIDTKTDPKLEPKNKPFSFSQSRVKPSANRRVPIGIMRTCNCCVRELPEANFLHCTTCEDFDLCQSCFSIDAHGHHPSHGFIPAAKDTKMPDSIIAKMGPGRNYMHEALCDGCDKCIAGVRHKCLDCPDWDYCSECIKSVNLSHPGHRFAPIYERLSDLNLRLPPPVHVGICCDGPLCSATELQPKYIMGVRYKCAVCHDLDFCANCESSPMLSHNKTHPLIKFNTPVRHVSVSTTGEHPDGQRMPDMGDRETNVKATEILPASRSNSINAVRTIVDVKPTEPALAEVTISEVESNGEEHDEELKQECKEEPKEECKEECKEELKEEPKESKREQRGGPCQGLRPVADKKWAPYPLPLAPKEELKGVFVSDAVKDGTIFPPNHVFEQTWTLRNEGRVTWPAGCSVRLVSGDYMGHVDSNHPAEISELVSASESTVCYAPLAPGQEFPFTVLLRTPPRAGKFISYWRLTTPDGEKFGHCLWCDVSVRMIKTEPTLEPTSELKAAPVDKIKVESDTQSSSQMIYPTLEKESPMASIHESVSSAPSIEEMPEMKESDPDDEEWNYSDEGFMTDEEYDILDASDEEFLDEQKKRSS